MDGTGSPKVYSLTSVEVEAGLKTFQCIDTNKDGFLSKDEIKQYLTHAANLDDNSAEKALVWFMDKYDTNMDDKINYVEFLQFLSGTFS